MKASGLVSIVGAALLASSSAYAIVNFTWNPAGAGLTTENSPGNSLITANNITIADYASIAIPANPTLPGSINESGVLAVSGLNFQGGTFGGGFVNGTSTTPLAAIGGATAYKLYFTFVSTSHLAPAGVNDFKGAFDTLTYTLLGDKGGHCNFDTGGIIGGSCGADSQITLANGALIGTPNTKENQVEILNGIPSASVLLSFNPLLAGFFVSPTNVTLNMSGAFTNDENVVGGTCSPVTPVNCTVTIDGGGGNLTFKGTVPEPGTLWLLGAGLLGLAGMGRLMRARS